MKTIKKHILIVSNMETANRELTGWMENEGQFDFTVVHTDEKAIEACHVQEFDMVIVDDSDLDIDYRKLQAVLPILHEEVAMLRYEGDEAVLLNKKVRAVFTKRRNNHIRRFLVLDSSGPGTWENLPPFSVN